MHPFLCPSFKLVFGALSQSSSLESRVGPPLAKGECAEVLIMHFCFMRFWGPLQYLSDASAFLADHHRGTPPFYRPPADWFGDFPGRHCRLAQGKRYTAPHVTISSCKPVSARIMALPSIQWHRFPVSIVVGFRSGSAKATELCLSASYLTRNEAGMRRIGRAFG